ncbi:MAG TPA: metal-dependent transcriptional regulator [Lachnospiraceae bacterium]|nr:metal-dependent transcriptional regulator [Lachnospiraceae bacterium]
MYESGENYLETILVLEKKLGTVRSIDIARELEFSKPSVSRAVGLLKENNFIEIDGDGFIKLTKTGRTMAESIYDRHKVLTEFFVKIAEVSIEVAEEDACRIEHVISPETFSGIKNFLKNN